MTINAKITTGTDPVTKNGVRVQVLRIAGDMDGSELKGIVDKAIREVSGNRALTHPVEVFLDAGFRSSGENVVRVYASGPVDDTGYKNYFREIKAHLEA